MAEIINRNEELGPNPHEIFADSLKNKQLPREISPFMFVEAMDHPSHYPNLIETLRLFGTDPQTTYHTEYHGQHLPTDQVPTLNARYEQERKQGKERKLPWPLSQPYSKRLQMLSLAHLPDWQNGGLQLYYLMSEKVGPALGYRFNLEPAGNTDMPGDYHQIAGWIAQHYRELASIYFDQANLETATAYVARGRHIQLNGEAVGQLHQNFNSLLGPVNLETSRVKKGKVIDPTTELFPRAGATSIVREFETFFTRTGFTDPEAVGNALGIDGLTPEALNYYQSHITKLSLLMLGLYQDEPDGYQPLQKLAALTQTPLPHTVDQLRLLATQPPSAATNQEYTAIDANTGTSLSQAVDRLQPLALRPENPGFGAAHGLLVKYTDHRLKGDDQAADMWEQLMQQFNILAKDPEMANRLGLFNLNP